VYSTCPHQYRHHSAPRDTLLARLFV
jgi:hypothetical protein